MDNYVYPFFTLAHGETKILPVSVREKGVAYL